MTIGGLSPNVSLPMAPRVDFAYGFNNITQITGRSCSDSSFVWYPQLSSTTTYGTANNVNQYPTVDGVPFTYDGNGCLTNDGVNTYGYDSESKLISVVTPASTVNYKYDPLGRLVQKTIGSSSVRYLYSGLQRIEEYDGTGTLLRRYVYGAALDECLFVIDATTGDVNYLHADDTGSTVLLTDANGLPTVRNVYMPWGELSSGSLSDIGIGFTGQFFDQDTGLYYYKARHYSPELGRFLQTDPIGYAGGLNLYEYCGSDPVNSTDPLGLDEVTQTGDSSFNIEVNNNPTPQEPGYAGIGDGSGYNPVGLYGGYPLYGGPGGINGSGVPYTGNIYVDTAIAIQIFLADKQAESDAYGRALAAQQAAIAAALRAAEEKLLGQSVDAAKALFGPGIQNIQNNPVLYGGAFVFGAAFLARQAITQAILPVAAAAIIRFSNPAQALFARPQSWSVNLGGKLDLYHNLSDTVVKNVIQNGTIDRVKGLYTQYSTVGKAFYNDKFVLGRFQVGVNTETGSAVVTHGVFIPSRFR